MTFIGSKFDIIQQYVLSHWPSCLASSVTNFEKSTTVFFTPPTIWPGTISTGKLKARQQFGRDGYLD